MNNLSTQQRGSGLAHPNEPGSTDGNGLGGSGTVEVIETVAVAGGAALVIFGAGLMMAHPGIRRLVVSGLTRALPEIEAPLKQGLSGLVTDLERYMKIRSM